MTYHPRDLLRLLQSIGRGLNASHSTTPTIKEGAAIVTERVEDIPPLTADEIKYIRARKKADDRRAWLFSNIKAMFIAAFVLSTAFVSIVKGWDFVSARFFRWPK